MYVFIEAFSALNYIAASMPTFILFIKQKLILFFQFTKYKITANN